MVAGGYQHRRGVHAREGGPIGLRKLVCGTGPRFKGPTVGLGTVRRRGRTALAMREVKVLDGWSPSLGPWQPSPEGEQPAVRTATHRGGGVGGRFGCGALQLDAEAERAQLLSAVTAGSETGVAATRVARSAELEPAQADRVERETGAAATRVARSTEPEPAPVDQLVPETRPVATLVDLFGAQARLTPFTTAIIDRAATGQREWTYAEFATRVYRLARRLVDAGVGPETLVALGMRRSVDLVVAMYAVLEAGGGYLPLDLDQPAERIGQVLDTAKPVCVLTTARDDFDTGLPTITVETEDLSGYPATPLTGAERRAPLRGAHPAYVIFTSGSTGRPKGVAVSHAAVVNQIRWLTAEYRIGPADTVLFELHPRGRDRRAAGHRRRAAQPVRAHRVHRARHPRRGRRRRHRRGADRRAGVERTRLRAGRAAAPGAGRRRGRAVPGGRPDRARLPRPTRSDR